MKATELTTEQIEAALQKQRRRIQSIPPIVPSADGVTTTIYKGPTVIRGLGDYTESVLASIGVTADRYTAAKSFFGLAPTCNCESRKEWLNNVSAWWRGETDGN